MFGDVMENKNLEMYYDISYKVSTYVFDYRKAHKLTQTQLAKKIGTTSQMVGKIESGNYNISLENLCDIMAKLNAHINIMFIDK